MKDTLPKMHTCENCGFISTKGSEFEMVGDEKLCVACVKLHTLLFYYEADDGPGLIRGRSIHKAHDNLASRIGLENVYVFREATKDDISRLKSAGGKVGKSL